MRPAWLNYLGTFLGYGYDQIEVLTIEKGSDAEFLDGSEAPDVCLEVLDLDLDAILDLDDLGHVMEAVAQKAFKVVLEHFDDPFHGSEPGIDGAGEPAIKERFRALGIAEAPKAVERFSQLPGFGDVNAQICDRLAIPAFDRPRAYRIDRLPFQAENLAHILHAGTALHNLDSESVKNRHEAPMLTRPRHRHVPSLAAVRLR